MSNPSQVFASELLANLVAHGVRDFYLAPGARSQALAIALSQLADAGHISLTIRLDERSLGFTALGRAQATGSPAAVITTSGTAVANLHPAVLEAHHAGLPLLVLSSDRPARLRDRGANQTTHQENIFGFAAPCLDVEAPSANNEPDAKALVSDALKLMFGSQRPTPVQLNLQFDEPLSASEPNAAQVFQKLSEVQISFDRSIQSTEIEIDNHTVVIAGAGAGKAAVDFATNANLPLFAEPSSGSRYGSQVVVNYPELLKGELKDQIRKVVVFGKPSLSRSVMKVIQTSELYVVRSNYEPFDPFANAVMTVDQVVPVGKAQSSWLESWQAETSVDPRAEFVTAVWDSVSDQALVFGASDLIRVAEGCVKPREIQVFSNRGLAGIDGTVSTAIGVAQSGLDVKVILGDLTLIHEIAGLNLSGLADLNVQLIVGNDNGGHIFDRLEMREHLSDKWFEKLFTTPQSIDLETVAVGFGWKYLKPKTVAELESAMQTTGFVVIDYQL